MTFHWRLRYDSSVDYFRLHRTLIALVAGMTILLGSIMPTISHALASRQQSGSSFLSAICTTSDSKFVALNFQAGKPPGQNQSDKPMSMDHCPYCFTHAGSFGIISHLELAISPLALSQPLPRLFYQSPYPLFAWVSSSPRAPPLFS
jgi:hypothetical protein